MSFFPLIWTVGGGEASSQLIGLMRLNHTNQWAAGEGGGVGMWRDNFPTLRDAGVGFLPGESALFKLFRLCAIFNGVIFYCLTPIN